MRVAGDRARMPESGFSDWTLTLFTKRTFIRTSAREARAAGTPAGTTLPCALPKRRSPRCRTE